MSDVDRDERLLEVFARLADTLVEGYQVVDLLQVLVDACTEVIDSKAAGILLADEDGQLELVASTSESSRLVEIMQLSAHAGPCIESFITGRAVTVPDIAATPDAWAEFRASALDEGFGSALAIPMRLRSTRIGTLNLFNDEVGQPAHRDVLAAQALADVATIGILQERAIRETSVVAEQLQRALTSRVLIEQAKGVVSYSHDLTMEAAFAMIRNYARSHNLGLAQVAEMVVARTLVL